MTLYSDYPYCRDGFPKFIWPNDDRIPAWKEALKAFAAEFGIRDPLEAEFGFVSVYTVH